MEGSGQTRPLGRISRRVRETGRLHWHALSRAGRVAIFGVLASAALAVALGVLIPRVDERHVLGARLDAIVGMIQVLEREHLIPHLDQQLTQEDHERFDSMVRGSLLGGENVRVKVWNLAGTVVYSDEPRQVGERFPITPALAAAFAGTPTVEISDLSAEENRLDRTLGSEALEFYVPLRGGDGDVIGAFEIYQDSGPVLAHLAVVERTVWIAVGTGLSILFVFLALLFGATARSMAAEERIAQERAEDLAVLLRSSRALSSQPELDRTAPQVLDQLTDRLGLRSAALYLNRDGPRLTRAGPDQPVPCPHAAACAADAIASGQAIERVGSDDAAQARADGAAPCSVLAVPFPIGPEGTGAIVVCREPEARFRPRERALVEAVAGELGVAAESAALFTDLRDVTQARGRLLRQLVDAQEEERRRLVGDLHDGMGQTLTRVLYGLRGSRTRLERSGPEVATELVRLESLVDGMIADLRRNMAAIRPALVEDLGLPEALGAFAREQEQEADLHIDVRADPLPAIDPAVAVTLFRATQEAVINARKHGDARRLWIELQQHDGAVVLAVRDDGRGAARLRDGIGLTYMKERAASLGGRVDVSSRPGAGTTVVISVPTDVAHGTGSRPRR